MSVPQLAEDAVQVAVLAPCDRASLAAGTLALHLGIARTAAEALLSAGGGLFVARSRVASFKAAMPILAALGVQVALRPAYAAAEPELCDLSLRLGGPLANAVAVMERLGLSRATQEADFSGPAGWLIESLPRPRAEEMALALRALPGAQVTLAAQSGARYDLFARGGRVGPEQNALRHHLAVLGCATQGPCRALATGLDRRTLQHLLARFGHLGLTGVHQAFQRYDLVLTGQGRLTQNELRDFLATRGADWSAARVALETGQGLRIEGGLSRAAARQFLSDYATIGLPTRADLTGL